MSKTGMVRLPSLAKLSLAFSCDFSYWFLTWIHFPAFIFFFCITVSAEPFSYVVIIFPKAFKRFQTVSYVNANSGLPGTVCDYQQKSQQTFTCFTNTKSTPSPNLEDRDTRSWNRFPTIWPMTWGLLSVWKKLSETPRTSRIGSFLLPRLTSPSDNDDDDDEVFFIYNVLKDHFSS